MVENVSVKVICHPKSSPLLNHYSKNNSSLMHWNIKFISNKGPSSVYFLIFYLYFVTECSESALGMEHGHIKDVDITASSTFDYHSVGPHIGR